MWFPAFLMLLACFCVTGTPSPLRLGHSGYEIISFNDHGSEEAASGKLEVVKTSPYEGISFHGIEKAVEALGSGDDQLKKSSDLKRNWEVSRSTSRSPTVPIVRHNMIEIGSKDSGRLGPRSGDLYLTLGSPRRLSYGETNERKDFADYFTSIGSAELNSNSFLDDFMEHHRVDLGNRGKVIATIMRSRLKEKKREEATKSKNKFSSVDSDKRPKSVGIPVMPNFSAIKVDRSGNFWTPSKPSAIYSPIYASGIDVSTDIGPTKSMLSNNLLALKVNRPLTPINEVGKARSRDDFYDNTYLDSKVDYRVAKSVSKSDHSKDQPDSLNVTTFKPSLVIDILHEITPEPNESSYVAGNKPEQAVKQASHEVENLTRPHHELNMASSKCKKMKSSTTPAFYQFLTKFSDLIFENALQYETNLQIRDSAVKLIDAGKKHIADDEFSSMII